MKKLYPIVLFLIFVTKIYAQEVEVVDSINRTVSEAAEEIFQNIDNADITTGFLVDRSLSAMDFGNFTGIPQFLKDTTEHQQWKHLYGVFKRNAENETDVWNSDLILNIFTIDSLIEVRGLTGDNVFPCVFFDIDTEEWYNQYNNEKQYLLDISLNYPPQLPRI